MSKYLFRCNYTPAGLKGLIAEGGTKRHEAVSQGFASLGGKVEAYYYAFGYTDLFIIVDLPDNVNATAASLVGNVAGTSKIEVTVLLTPEEVDQATKLTQEKLAAYRPPGQ
jgi:uncharacterized protein with GYD domain